MGYNMLNSKKVLDFAAFFDFIFLNVTSELRVKKS